MAGYAVNLRAARNDTITSFAGNAALLRAYDGVQPATGGAATNLLAEWAMGTPFAPGAGVTLLPTLPADTVGVANGQVTWFRLVKADGVTFIMDIPISQVTLSTNQISIGLPCKVLSFVITAGNA